MDIIRVQTSHPEGFIAALKDDQLYYEFHAVCKDLNVKIIEPWQQKARLNQWSRSSRFTAPISSSAARMTTGISKNTVQESTTISTEGGGQRFSSQTEMCFGPKNSMFSNLTGQVTLKGAVCQGFVEIEGHTSMQVPSPQPYIW